MRIVTFNLLARDQADGPAREVVARRVLGELRPDVVALQEVTRTADVDQARYLLGPDVTVVDHPGRSANGVGACLATRWPVDDVHVLDLHLTERVDLPWAAAVAVEVRAPAPLGPVLVVHHKPSWQAGHERERELQAVAVARFVDLLTGSRPELPVVLLGDLDAAPDTASLRFLTGRQSLEGVSVHYDDAWAAVHPDRPGYTRDRRNPLVVRGEIPLERDRRIDHVLTRAGPHGALLAVADCRLLCDEPVDGLWVSDHCGVVADLEPPPHPPGTWA